MKDENLVWEEISTEHIVQDEWIDIRRSAYRFPNGQIWQPYYSFSRRNYAVVVASDELGHFICVRQFRQGPRQSHQDSRAGRPVIGSGNGLLPVSCLLLLVGSDPAVIMRPDHDPG